MKHLHIFSILAVSVLLLAACQSSSRVIGEGESGEAEGDSTRVYTNAIHVLVDGRNVGTIPKTVRVRRSFGTRMISLWQAGEEIRKYEMQISPTSEGDQTLMGFWGTPSTDGASFDVRNLPHKDEIYQIPYSSQPMKIEDRQYDVTLLIRE